MATQQEHQLTLKLLIDSKSDKVLFAEAGKSVVDFLFNLLSMPISSVIKLLTKDQMVGCIANLYRSVETLDTAYMLSNQNKTILLNPTTISLTSNALFLTGPSSSSPSQKKYYKCSNKSCIKCPSSPTLTTLISNTRFLTEPSSTPPSDKKYCKCSNSSCYECNYGETYCGSSYYTEVTIASSPSQKKYNKGKKYNKPSNKICVSCPSLSSFGTGSSSLFGPVAAHSYRAAPTPRKICVSNYYTETKNVACPTCDCQMSTEMQLLDLNPQLVTKAEAGVGFVKGVVTYTVMDDLSVMPMSSISSIALLNKLNVKDVGSLEERTVTLGMEEGLELLKASLQSKTVLTDVFMRKKTATAVVVL